MKPTDAGHPAKQLKAMIRAWAKTAYLSLPISYTQKRWLAGLLYRHAGFLFQGIVHYENWKRGQASAASLPTAEGAVDIDNINRVLASLQFLAPAAPVVSILLCAGDDLTATLTTLRSLARHVEQELAEVILVQGNSSNPDLDRLSAIPDLKVIRSATTQRFAESCNQGLTQALGEFICLVMPGNEVTAGWLSRLLAVQRGANSCVITGSRLITSQGQILEAGGLLGSDGSVQHFGTMQRAQASACNYLREADFCSPDGLLIRRTFLTQAGSFDTRCIEPIEAAIDLACKARAAGNQVIYQPAAIVFVNSPALRSNFSQTQQYVIQQHHEATLPSARHKPTLLIIDQYVPQPDRDAGSRTMWQMIKVLVTHGVSVKFWPANLWYDPGYTEQLQQLGVEVFYGSEYEGKFARWLAQHNAEIDAILLSRPQVAIEFIDEVRSKSQAQILFYGHDIHYLRLQEQAKFDHAKSLQKEIERIRSVEEAIWGKANAIYYPADGETHHVQQWLTQHGLVSRAATMPAYGFEALDEDPAANLATRRDLMFVASFSHPPNADGAQWFVHDVLPLIQQAVPQTRLYLIGSNPGEQVKALAGPLVEVTGYVTDAALESYYRNCRISVAPLRFGGGMKGKVAEAMHFGIPCVTTEAGAQGLAEAGHFLRAADDPRLFADHVIDLLRDDSAWARNSHDAQQFAKQHFSEDAMWGVLSEDINEKRGESELNGLNETFGTKFKSAVNNFDLIRLFAALAVVLAHSYSLSKSGPDPITASLHYGYAGGLAVSVFFVISGFLIAKSVESHSLQDYMLSRVLRIVPALAVVTLVETFIVGPRFYDMGTLQTYFLDIAPYHLLNVFVFGIDPGMLGVFSSLPYPFVNGSLWSLPVESIFYLLLPLLFVLANWRRWVLLILFAGSLFAEPVARLCGIDDAHGSIALFRTVSVFQFAEFFSYFMAGVVAWSYRNFIPCNRGAIALCLLLLFAARDSYASALVLKLCLPYLVLYLGLAGGYGSWLKQKVGDLSYGVYLIGYPIINTIIALTALRWSGGRIFEVAAILSILYAWCSWRFVEKPVLKLKFARISPPPLK